MTSTVPPWIRTLGQWLLCAPAGALLCVALVAVLMDRDCLPIAMRATIHGGLLGLLAGGLVLTALCLADRMRSGIGPGGLILTALGTCVGLAAGVWATFAMVGGLLLAYGGPDEEVCPARSLYLTPDDVVGLGLLGGMCMALLLWGWPSKSRRIATRKTAVVGSILVVVAWLAWPPWSPLWRPTVRNARAGSCECNLRQLGLGLAMYVEDNDGRLPPCRTANDLPGVDDATLAHMLARDGRLGQSQAVLGGGALWPYVKNAGLFLCPADPWSLNWQGRPILDRFPEPGIGYEWNAKWAGKRLSGVPAEGWLLRDRGAWHPGGRNVLSADGRVRREARP